MNHKDALKKAKEMVRMDKIGHNFYQIKVYDDKRKAWIASNIGAYHMALGYKRENIVSVACALLNYNLYDIEAVIFRHNIDYTTTDSLYKKVLEELEKE